MGRLYDTCKQVIEHIDSSGEDVFKARGSIAMRTGFLITLVREDDPDDPAKINAVISAAEEVLGFHVTA